MSIVNKVVGWFKRKNTTIGTPTNTEIKRAYRASKGQARKTVPFTQYERILKGMTNWQNSQWLRAGGPALTDYDEMLALATYYRLLPKGFKHES